MNVNGHTTVVAPLRSYAEPEEIPLVTPLHIFAARRQSFDAIVRSRLMTATEVVAVLFDALPLKENGWDQATAHIEQIGQTNWRFPIWRLRRGE